jgi:fatty acid desaturase (delta-4 desaturase)
VPSSGPGAGAAPGADLDIIYGGARPSRRAPLPSSIAAPGGAPGAGELTAVLARGGVAAERGGAWARAVLRAVAPRRALLLGSMPAELYRGVGDPSQEFLTFVLATSQHKAAAAAPAAAAGGGAPVPLPSGSIVAGAPAALLAACELWGINAQLLVSVDQVLALVPDSLPHLAAGAAALLAAGAGGGGGGGLAAALRDAARVAAARASLEQHAARARVTGSVYA